MKKFILKSLIIFTVVTSVNLLYLQLIQKTDWNFKKRIEANNLVNPKYDYLVLGHSLAMDGIDTKYMSDNGYYAYNLSIGGSSLKSNYVQLEEYFKKNDYKPKCVILGLGSFISSFTTDQIHPVVEFTSDENSYGFDDVPMIKFQWMFKEFLKKVVSKKHRDAYLENGQLKFLKVVSDTTEFNYDNKLLVDKFTGSILIEDIVNLCSSYNVKVLIVEMPGFKKMRHPKSQDSKVIEAKFKDAFFIDFNTIEFGEVFNDDKDWIGNSHLNGYGAKKFTVELLKKLNTPAYNFN